MSSLDDSLAASSAPEGHTALRADVALMRELGVTRWRDIELGAAPFQPTTDEPTQQKFSPEQLSEATRKERARIMMAASGGPVRRLSGHSE